MKSRPSTLRDFTVDRRVWLLSGVALVIGAGAAVLAVFLLKAIALCHEYLLLPPAEPGVGVAGGPLPLGMQPLVPIVGGLIVGLMARYGSDKIRGHGIPEAIEAILLRGARVEPKVAVLKPISAAISIGSGGPFGAEGPIIMTGGAFGSLVAQWMHLTDAERTTLLVAGAAAGMSATFAAPHGGDPAGGGAAAVRVEAALADSGGVGQRYGGHGADCVAGRGAAVCHADFRARFRWRICSSGRAAGIAGGLCRGGAEPHDVRVRGPV